MSNPDSIRESIRYLRPDIIVNAAAYTAVDKAESEADIAMAVNGAAPGHHGGRGRAAECHSCPLLDRLRIRWFEIITL